MDASSTQGGARILATTQLYTPCSAAELPFTSSDELEPLSGHPGQERAREALDFSLNTLHEGFNTYIIGSTGLGRHDLLQEVLEARLAEQRAHNGRTLHDWCYVHNFSEPSRPRLLRLPCGMGRQLRDALQHTVEELLGLLPEVFESEAYQSEAQALGEQFQERESDTLSALAERAAKDNVALIKTPSGYSLAPMQAGKVISPQDFEQLPEASREAIMASIDRYRDELKQLLRQMPAWKREAQERFRSLNQDICRQAIDPLLEQLKQQYAAQQQVLDYLEQVHKDLLEEAETLAQREEGKATPHQLHERAEALSQYAVNVLVSNEGEQQPPVVHEDNPSYANLLGRCEHIAHMGTLVTDFTLIRAGALHRANGGFLVLDAHRVLSNPYAWMGLKRALKARELRTESLDQLFSFASTVQLEPEPIPLDVRVILIGDRLTWYLLREYDPEFSTLFKLSADMAEDVPRTAETTLLFARLLRSLQQQAELLPLSRDAIARVIEHAARRCGDSARLDLHRGHLRDLLIEADFLTRRDAQTQIDDAAVKRAVAAADRRRAQAHERVREQILRGITLVRTEGTAVAEINGLAVYQLDDYAFGCPTRITATARLGHGKVLNIEREAELSGKTHSKAVLIIAALLSHRYARERPLPLSATLVFEQSYAGIEGDSASVAEFVALISAITELPLRQDLAVTGSLNQHGRVQAIGDVNQKIEGFHAICRERGLSGTQGVLMPAANRVHLMLSEAVREDVTAGRFQVYTMERIEDALELFTGRSREDIDALVEARLSELTETARRLNQHNDQEEPGGATQP